MFSILQVLSLLAIQILELAASLLLLKSTAKPEYEVVSFFKTDELSEKRNWLLASSLGFGFLVLLVFLTSLVADRLIGPKVGFWIYLFLFLNAFKPSLYHWWCALTISGWGFIQILYTKPGHNVLSINWLSICFWRFWFSLLL